MDVVLLHNEKAGDGKWSRKDLVKLVERAGFKPRYASVKEALANPDKTLTRGEFVIVAGGDGALCKVALALLGRDLPIAPLPLGTANNIARSFGLPKKLADIAAGWKRGKLRAFDVGAAHGPWGRRHFIEGVGFGLLSRAITLLEEMDTASAVSLQKPRHKLHRDVCVTTALAHELQPVRARLTLGDRSTESDFLMVEVLNIRRAGPGLQLAPRADPADQHFDIVTATARERSTLLRALRARLAEAEPPKSLRTRRSARVEMKVHAPCEIRIDDDTLSLRANTTVEFTVVPAALTFLLPD